MVVLAELLVVAQPMVILVEQAEQAVLEANGDLLDLQVVMHSLQAVLVVPQGAL
jgi:hypothetical protein